MNHPPFPVVFTDLDGTLLDFDSYSFAPAADALALLAARRIPLVFCSSKTRAEIECCQQEMGVSHPFVAENGGALFVPRGYFDFDIEPSSRRCQYDVIEFARPYAAARAALGTAARLARAGVIGFGDLTVEQLARESGLSSTQARLAKRREYDEAFRVIDTDEDTRRRLFTAIRGTGFHCTSGGRYHHVIGGGGKGYAVQTARRLFAKAAGRPVLGIGLGDGLNDLPLLVQMDLPVIVRNRGAWQAATVLQRLPVARVTAREGVLGWSDVVTEVVQAMDAQRGARP